MLKCSKLLKLYSGAQLRKSSHCSNCSHCSNSKSAVEIAKIAQKLLCPSAQNAQVIKCKYAKLLKGSNYSNFTICLNCLIFSNGSNDQMQMQ